MLFTLLIGAGCGMASEENPADKDTPFAPLTPVEITDTTQPAEAPIPVIAKNAAELVGEEVKLDDEKATPKPRPVATAADEKAPSPTQTSDSGAQWLGRIIQRISGERIAPAPVVVLSENKEVAIPVFSPMPASAKTDGDAKSAAPTPTPDDKDRPAEKPGDKPGDKPAEKVVEGPKSNRAEICDEEMESVYAPPTIEGYSGWKKNKVYHDELIDNDMIAIPDRWRIGIPKDSRHAKGDLWNPYRQNMIKGDYPIWGQNQFLNATFTSDSFVEGHSNPTPSGVSTQRPGSFEFFGRPDQWLFQQNFEISLEFFRGETDFKPREWEIRLTPVFNFNYTNVEENFAINIDPRQRNSRLDGHVALQEAFGEYHFRDLSANYDFVSSRTGTQFFNEDFRGFLFADNNLGERIFGNLESNRLQYNLSYFEMLNKDTNSGLNTFNFKDQHVVLANVIRGDTFFKGYNIIGQFAFSDEESSQHYNQNDVIVRPAPIGDLATHANKVYYLGFGGDGHIGRLNLTHQFYQALGEVSHDPLAGRREHVNAQMFAFEGSYDMDWMRFRSSYFYASGDQKTLDGKAGGFDSIFDDPNFAGGQFSWWVSQGGFGAGNALTQLKSRNSLLPSLNTSKGEGQREFVNPGLHLYNVGYDADLTQKLKAIINVNFLQFDNTSSLEELLHQNAIRRNIGYDSSIGMQYRPFLNNQVIINGGISTLTPLDGFKDLYSPKQLYAGFLSFTVRY
ncbi:MAG TPA: hypothetical protein VKX17_08245 [Planctomycetota bacterium]|nr:hypothetical protein [Planctomycetota bacterium]